MLFSMLYVSPQGLRKGRVVSFHADRRVCVRRSARVRVHVHAHRRVHMYATMRAVTAHVVAHNMRDDAWTLAAWQLPRSLGHEFRRNCEKFRFVRNLKFV